MPRKTLPNCLTKQEQDEITRRVRAGESYAAIARALKRSNAAIVRAAHAMGVRSTCKSSQTPGTQAWVRGEKATVTDGTV